MSDVNDQFVLLFDMLRDAQNEKDALRRKLDKALDALRVYANKNNWAPSVNMPQRHFISNQHGYTEAARILAELEQE